MHPYYIVAFLVRTTARLISPRGAATLALVATALLGCGGGSDGTGPGGGGGGGGGCGTLGSNQVCVDNNFFSPKTLTVASGATVTWVWAQGSLQHNVTFDQGNVNSPTQSSGTYQRTFAAAGSFPYHCTIHGASMSGTVTVQP